MSLPKYLYVISIHLEIYILDIHQNILHLACSILWFWSLFSRMSEMHRVHHFYMFFALDGSLQSLKLSIVPTFSHIPPILFLASVYLKPETWNPIMHQFLHVPSWKICSYDFLHCSLGLLGSQTSLTN